MSKQIDLTFVSTNDLIEELFKRYDGIIIGGVKFTNVNGDYVALRRWQGNLTVCSNLATQLEHMLIQEILRLENKSDK